MFIKVQWWFQPCCTADDQLPVKHIESKEPWWKWSTLCPLSVKQHTVQASFMLLYLWKNRSWPKYANELWDRFLRSTHCWYTNVLVCLMTSRNSLTSALQFVYQRKKSQWHEIHMPISHITFAKLHQLSIEVIWLTRFHLEPHMVAFTETVCSGYAWGVIIV